MSGTDQLIYIDAEDPKYYADLLYNIPRTANRRLLSDGQSCSDVPGTQNVDIALTRRLQTLLDAVADISLCRRGNVSATMTSLKDNAGLLETQLYIVLNHQEDESAVYCSQHLQNIFNILRQVPYRPLPLDGSPKLIARELESNHIEICQAIHNYSFDVFCYRVTKRVNKLSKIRGYIEQDQTDYFSDRQRSTLLEFFYHVDRIITMTTTTLRNNFPPPI
ncbi:hypothetical protein BJV74DRAFT_884679 [Russula compacta]|nr:hypothetical protein BJV74DRAFT_884679 [Russula compacta]